MINMLTCLNCTFNKHETFIILLSFNNSSSLEALIACQWLRLMGYHDRCFTYKSVTSEVFSNSRIGSNSTNKQEDEDEEDEAPL